MSDRLYYSDPSLAFFDAQVSEIRELSRSEGRSLWQVALDRSAFYPTSGGQPHDTGMLTATSAGGSLLEAPVLEVEEDEHGVVWHTTPKPLSAGTVVRGYIDWSRRRDHMQQHSGQHLLSAVLYRQLGAPTVSFHLGEMTSSIDLAREAITPEELERVEDTVNEVVAENRPVTMKTVPRQEAEMLLAAGALQKLPQREGDIRLIEIEEIDLNACGGTHVQATGQIGSLLLRGTERMRQGLRVEFVCGDACGGDRPAGFGDPHPRGGCSFRRPPRSPGCGGTPPGRKQGRPQSTSKANGGARRLPRHAAHG